MALIDRAGVRRVRIRRGVRDGPGSTKWRQELRDHAAAAALRGGVLPEWVSQEAARLAETLDTEVFIMDSRDLDAPVVALEIESNTLQLRSATYDAPWRP